METQTAIRLAVEKMLPEHAVPKDWTKPLPAWARKTLQSRIYGIVSAHKNAAGSALVPMGTSSAGNYVVNPGDSAYGVALGYQYAF